MDEGLLLKVKNYLIQQYAPHAIILYGSMAAGNHTEESDIDVACFCDRTIAKNDSAAVDGWQLDAWVYDTGMMDKPEGLLHLGEGRILLDERNLCAGLLKNIRALQEDAGQQSAQDIQFQKTWLQKMLKRAKKDDIEGNFRYHWLLYDSLEIYFAIKGMRYRGPKNSLAWIKEHDPAAYELFEGALKIAAPFEAGESLVSFLVGLDA